MLEMQYAARQGAPQYGSRGPRQQQQWQPQVAPQYGFAAMQYGGYQPQPYGGYAPQMRGPPQQFARPHPGMAPQYGMGMRMSRGGGMGFPPSRGGFSGRGLGAAAPPMMMRQKMPPPGMRPMMQGMMPAQGFAPAGMGMAAPGFAQMQRKDVSGAETLTAEALAAMSPEQQKNALGEQLYHKISEQQPDMAAKITGMLLEMDVSETLNLLESPDLLKSKIQEAIAVLRAHEAAAGGR